MNNLRKVRKERGLTQIQVADMVGINQNTYSYWENDKVKIDDKSLKKLADFYKVSIDYLLGREPSLSIPEEYKDLPVAFYEGAKDLKQEDIDDVIEYMEFLKSKNKK